MKVPARSDRAWFPPLGYVTVVMSIVMNLIVLFRDRGVVLSSECLSWMGRLFSDAQGCISFRSKWLDICTRDPSKGWISNFFYVHNDWGLQEKWGKLIELPVPLHIGAEDLLRIFKLPDLDALHYEMRYLSRYIDEEYLFKSHSKRPGSEEDLQALRKKKADEVLTVVSKGPRVSPSKSYIPEDVLNHQCIGRRRAEELNKEFVKVKYLQGEYKKKYDSKVKEMKVVEDQLEGSIEEFKKSYAFKIIIEDHIQEARNHIYDVEVKALEAECIEDGFIRGFMKGVRVVHRKTRAEIEGLTPSQASGDVSSDSGGEELESELQRAFALEEDEDDVEIL
ncbi:hypothetical protein IEQ34_021381 [Dendrobium chrysotoxum]|uniref:Uncharacterized protein n=1 Tax=Dendrobium chrysotoxum TaxID=161865 RepID=A0AAV7FMA3_DENCH|nr:hypothetical protein IEQ34_021381 [Dendrobium chrysotoxum]